MGDRPASNARFWLKATAWSGAARLSDMVAGIVFFGALARALNPTELGQWTLFLATWSLLETLREGASTSAFLRYAAGATPSGAARYRGALIQLSLAWCAVVALGAGGLLPLWSRHPQIVELAVGFAGLTIAATLAGTAHVFLQAERRFGGLFVQRFAAAVPRLAAGAMLFFGDVEHPVFVGLAALLLAQLASLGTAVPFLFRCSVSLRNTSTEVGQLFRHGRYAAGSRAGSAVHRSADTWLVAALAGAPALAAYGIAWKLADYTELLLQPLVKVLVPEISAHETAEAAASLASRATVALTAMSLVVSVPLVLLPGTAVRLLAGPGYDAAVPVVWMLLGFNLLRPLDRCFGVYLDAVGRPDLNAFKVLLALAVNLLLTTAALWAAPEGFALPLAAGASVVAAVVGVAVAHTTATSSGLPSPNDTLVRDLRWWAEASMAWLRDRLDARLWRTDVP